MSSDSLWFHSALGAKMLVVATVVLVVIGCAIAIALLTTSDRALRRRRLAWAGLLVFLVLVGAPIGMALLAFKPRTISQSSGPTSMPSVVLPSDSDVLVERKAVERGLLVLVHDKVLREMTDGNPETSEQPDTNDGKPETRREPTPLPEWVRDFKKDTGTENLVSVCVIRSGQFATVERAKAEALQKAVIAATRRIASRESYLTGDWYAPESLVQEHVVRQTHVETLERDFGTITAPMYRVYLQIDLSDAAMMPLVKSWQQSVVTHRLCLLGGVLGVAVILLGMLSMFLRPRKNATPPELPAARTT